MVSHSVYMFECQFHLRAVWTKENQPPRTRGHRSACAPAWHGVTVPEDPQATRVRPYTMSFASPKHVSGLLRSKNILDAGDVPAVAPED